MSRARLGEIRAEGGFVLTDESQEVDGEERRGEEREEQWLAHAHIIEDELDKLAGQNPYDDDLGPPRS